MDAKANGKEMLIKLLEMMEQELVKTQSGSKSLFLTGLCMLSEQCRLALCISEGLYLDWVFVQENALRLLAEAPSSFRLKFNYDGYEGYWWRVGEVPPRLEAVQYVLKELKK